MNYSVNPLTQEKYSIPKVLDDLSNVESFLEEHKGKKVIVVQGLGFVGAVMSLICANSISDEYAVIGIDLPSEESYWKIKSINNGEFPLVADDPKIEEFFNIAKKKRNFYATYDPVVFKYADIVIVDINLDVQKKSSVDLELENYDVNLEGFKSAITSIGQNCKENVFVLVETTVPPGTCQNIVKPILESELIKRDFDSESFSLGHSYERVMPGPQYVDSIQSYPRVFSGIDEKSAETTESFLRTIIDTNRCELTKLENTNATEIAKVLENSYRATNIAFVVEWSRFAEKAGVDLYSIVDAIRVRPTHSNLMYPGIGVGGYCLTKDPLLASWSIKEFFNSDSGLNISVNSVSTNDQMPKYAFKRLIEVFGPLDGKIVTFLGVSYRGDVGDTRFSPVEPMVSFVISAGAEVTLHDPYVSFWQEKVLSVKSDFDEAVKMQPDLVIISSGHSIYKTQDITNKIEKLSPMMIFDTIGLLTKNQIQILGQKHKISILGAGNE